MYEDRKTNLLESRCDDPRLRDSFDETSEDSETHRHLKKQLHKWEWELWRKADRDVEAYNKLHNKYRTERKKMDEDKLKEAAKPLGRCWYTNNFFADL